MTPSSHAGEHAGLAVLVQIVYGILVDAFYKCQSYTSKQSRKSEFHWMSAATNATSIVSCINSVALVWFAVLGLTSPYDWDAIYAIITSLVVGYCACDILMIGTFGMDGIFGMDPVYVIHHVAFSFVVGYGLYEHRQLGCTLLLVEATNIPVRICIHLRTHNIAGTYKKLFMTCAITAIVIWSAVVIASLSHMNWTPNARDYMIVACVSLCALAVLNIWGMARFVADAVKPQSSTEEAV